MRQIFLQRSLELTIWFSTMEQQRSLTSLHSSRLSSIHSRSNMKHDSRMHRKTLWVSSRLLSGSSSRKTSEKTSLRNRHDLAQWSGLIRLDELADQMQWEKQRWSDFKNIFLSIWEFTKSKIWIADFTTTHAQYTDTEQKSCDDLRLKNLFSFIAISSVLSGKHRNHIQSQNLLCRLTRTIMKSICFHHIRFLSEILSRRNSESSKPIKSSSITTTEESSRTFKSWSLPLQNHSQHNVNKSLSHTLKNGARHGCESCSRYSSRASSRAAAQVSSEVLNIPQSASHCVSQNRVRKGHLIDHQWVRLSRESRVLMAKNCCQLAHARWNNLSLKVSWDIPESSAEN